MEPVRINKFLADKGVASRREADRLIAAGQVLVNGQVAQLGQLVSENDEITTTSALSPSHLYFAYQKPRGQATEDAPYPAGTFPIGRLDKDSEGLLLVTNDGRLTGRLLDPKHHAEKEYVVTVDKKVAGIDLKRMSEGMTIESEKTRPTETEKLSEQTFKIVLTEGKKHQIRRMCAALGYQVEKLVRVRVGQIRLGQQAPGTFRALSAREQKNLLADLGLN